MARELFAAGFVSCWSELDDALQEQLVRSLEAALASPTIPPDIVTTLLNLAEFMEHDEKALPLDTRQGLCLSLCGRSGPCARFQRQLGPPYLSLQDFGSSRREVPRVCQSLALQGAGIPDLSEFGCRSAYQHQ